METPRRLLRTLHLENVQNKSTPLKIPASPLLRNLGHGTGVSVYRLDRSPKQGQTRSPWAVKRVTERSRTHNIDKLFNDRILQEAKVLRQLNHPNIIGFRGVVKSANGVPTLALECCNTSLGLILEERHDEDLGPLPVQQCVKMIYDIAQALDYLHTEAKFLHGDVKSFNILINGEFEICKLCDFGVSVPLDENGEVNFVQKPELQYIGTGIWSAPEIVDEVEIIDSKADIFSFGLVIYETLALCPPHMLDVDYKEEGIDMLDATGDSLDEEVAETNVDEQVAVAAAESNVDEINENIDNDENASAITVDDSVMDESNGDLNVSAAIGTRPPLPQAFQLTDDYNSIVEMFYCCTNALSEDRPSANTIWKTIKEMKLGEQQLDDSSNVADEKQTN